MSEFWGVRAKRFSHEGLECFSFVVCEVESDNAFDVAFVIAELWLAGGPCWVRSRAAWERMGRSPLPSHSTLLLDNRVFWQGIVNRVVL